MFYPIFLNLKNKRVVVIGGGVVAERKVTSLLDTGATVVVISPKVTPRLASLADAKSIDLHQREYAQGDCSGATLVLSAVDDGEVSRRIWKEATAAGILINTADQPALCDFIMPAVVRRGDLAIAISTGGTSPALAARLREQLSELFGLEYGRLADLLAEVRPEIQSRIPDEEGRKAVHYRILDSDIIERLRDNDSAGAESRLRQIIEDFACEKRTT